MHPLGPIPDRPAGVHRVAQHANSFGIGIQRRVHLSVTSGTRDTLFVERLRDLAVGFWVQHFGLTWTPPDHRVHDERGGDALQDRYGTTGAGCTSA